MGNNVLVVEDDKCNLMLFTHQVRSSGFNPLSAGNGMEAIEVVGNEDVDVIVLDLMMPYMDGMRFLKWLRNERQSKVPVIMLTAVDDPAVVGELRENGADEVMTKPVDPDTLVTNLRKFIEPNE